jgi:ubiquitin-protein ligase
MRVGGSEEGFFNAEMRFPEDFPSSPPEMVFLSEMWHPNSASLGRVRVATSRGLCVSFMHWGCTPLWCGSLP